MRYLVVLRPADEDLEVAGPTGFGGVIASSRAMADALRPIANLEHSDATGLIADKPNALWTPTTSAGGKPAT